MKKILKRLLIFAFIFTCFMATTGKEVNAASDTYVREFDGSDVSTYKQAKKAPIPELSANQYNDWIFAGWYTNEACTTAMTTAPVEGTKYYAKFVPSEILNVKCQVSAETDWNSASSDLRLVSSVDSLEYEEVGFEISYNGGKAFKISTDTVYRKIEAGKGGVSYGYSPNIFDLDSEYFITATLKNINNANFYKGFYIKAYWVTLDGTTVYGTSRYARVEDSYLNIANVPVRFVTEATTTADTETTTTFTYDASKFTYAENYESKLMDGTTTTSSLGYANGSTFDSIVISNSVVDNVGTITITGTATNVASLHGEIVHLRLKADDVTSLPRKNTFQVTYNGSETVTPVEGVYDYLSTAYSFADEQWFADNPNATEYVIATPNELAGLATIVNAGEFANQTVYLGADIELNQGKATEWAEGTNTEGLFKWTPIGINGGGFTNCWYDGTVTGGTYTGGLVGRTCVGDIKISGCLNSGIVSGTTNVGGLIGFSQEYQGTHVTLSNSMNTGSVSGGNAGTTGALTGTVQGYLYVDKNSVYTVQAGPNYAFASVAATLYDIDKNVIAENKEQYISFTAISALHDLKAYNIVDRESWTARVDSYPIPSVFANGDYANAAKVGSEYVIDTDFVQKAENVYEISSAAELYGLALLSQTDGFAGKTFELTDNITVNPITIDVNGTDGIYYKWLPIGNADYPFEGKFTGTFIENGYTTISGLYKEWERENNIGLFAQTATQAEVKDFNLTNTYFCWSDVIEFNTRVGAIVGRGGGTFENIHSSAHVTSGWYGSGGILGQVCEDATIINCWYDGIAEGLRPDGSSYTGGMVGYLSAGTLTIKHSLVSGSATAYKNVGGFVGGVRDTGSLILEDNLFSGNISGGSSGYVGQYIGSVECTSATVPQVTFTACYGVSDDVTEDIGMLISKTIDGVVYSPVINGKANASVKSDRLIGYTGTENGLDYTTYWALTKNSTPGLQTFTADEDVYDGTGIDALLQLTYWDDVTIANAEDKGTGNYMITIKNPELGETDGSTGQSYYGYLVALGTNGFTAYSNDNGLNGEGVYNAIYTMGLDTADTVSDDWVVNVTYISYEENDSVTPKIYITFNTGQPLSKHLKAADVKSVNYSATDGSSVAQDNVTYHMLESSYEKFGAGSYIMQLKNGHFIIIDGGIWNDVEYLFKYLESLVPENNVDENGNKKKPIVEAWVFSHSDSDHMGPMLGVMKDVDTYKDRIYVEGFYYNEPNGDVFEAYAKDANWYTKALRNCASDVFKTTQKESPKIYRMQTGQRYTFGDVTMDIMLSQELLTMDDYAYTVANNYQQDAFNDTSTWCMFTIDGQKLLSAGDGSESGKKYVVNMYSDGYMTVDVFTALHHGLNTNASKNSSLIKVINPTLSNDEQEDFSKKCTVNKLVLYSYKHNMLVENQDDTFKNGEQNVFAVNWKQAEQNRSFIAYLESKSNNFTTGILVNNKGTEEYRNYLYFGEGACKLTFNGDTITATVAPFTY